VEKPSTASITITDTKADGGTAEKGKWTYRG
jgi:hypothetical protein